MQSVRDCDRTPEDEGGKQEYERATRSASPPSAETASGSPAECGNHAAAGYGTMSRVPPSGFFMRMLGGSGS